MKSTENRGFPDVFGRYVKEKRLKLGYSRKEFCEKFGYDPYYHTKMEMGVVEPYCSYKFAEKLRKDLVIEDELEKQEYDLALIAAVKTKNPISVTKILSFVIGNAYADWCSMDKETRLSWTQQLSFIQSELSEIVQSFRGELVANVLRINK
ncbi:MAG: hypothetical protein HRU09_00965 [Oligoflexales bacterium]|nr:hypothetical protein [Oligoflexales bacterium]